MDRGLAAIALLVLLVSGCVQPTPPSSSSSAPASQLAEVANGTALLLLSRARPLEAFSIDLTHAVRHGSPGPRTADSYQCASAVSPRGWQDYFSLPHHAQTEAFSGVRTPQASAWFGVQVGDEDGKESPGILGRFNSTAESALLLGSGVYREAGSLEVEAKDGIGFEASTVGRYWCLDGPYSIGSGTVTQSNTNVSASDLKWSATIEHGLLLRLKSANVRTEGFTIRTPSESFRLVADAESAAFCTHVTGPFSIEIQRLDSTGIGAWSWSLEVFDASLPGLKCSGWD